MGVDGIANQQGAGNRREKRARVLLAAKIRTNFGEEDVRLRDLSRKGALIECDTPPAPGTELVFARGDTVVPARVAWSGGRRAGLEFHDMIDESEVLAHTGRPAAASPATPSAPAFSMPIHVRQHSQQNNFRRPGIATHSLTAQERKLAEAWGVQVGITVSED